tara:strand:+ start:1029 stop:1529 length:501 start_codon:yes stop_codon:yes gene_type:complete
MSFLSLNSNAYARKNKIGEHKKVRAIDNQSERRSEDSGLNKKGQEPKKKIKSSEDTPIKEEKENKISFTDAKNALIFNQVKSSIFIELMYPEKKMIEVDCKTGEIITDIMMIPKVFWDIICFDAKTFTNNKNKFMLFDVAYWVATAKGVTYICLGKTVSLLKNDSI